MNYKGLSLTKGFSKFIWIPHPFKHSNVHDFYEIFEKKEKNSKPDYNPYEKTIFEVNRGLCDIYYCGSLGSIRRGFIISDKLKNLFQDYNLSEYVLFSNINLFYQGQQRDDYNFIYFYRDFVEYIDYKNSKFLLVDEEYFYELNHGTNADKLIFDKNIKIVSESDYSEKYHQLCKNFNRDIHTENLCIPEAMSYDVFCILNGFARGTYFSQRLVDRLALEKVKGLEYANNIYYTFECPPHIKVVMPSVGNTYVDKPLEIDIKSKKEIKAKPGDLRKKLVNRHKQIKTYFEKNTLKGSIDKFLKSTARGIHIRYIQDGKERIVEGITHNEFAQPYYENLKVPDVMQVIEKLKEGIENLEEIVDKTYIKSELRRLLNTIEEISKKASKNYNCLVFDLDYDGACDVQIIMDEEMEIASNYNYSDINAVYEYAPSANELAQHLFQLLEECDYAGLQELFEDVPYIAKLRDMLLSKIYIVLHDCIDEMTSELRFEKAHFPLFVFAKDKYSDSDTISNIFILKKND